MLPAGISTSTPTHTTNTSGGSSRSGRLRGLSYLRHYAHGHHHNQHSGLTPAGATPGSTYTAANSPTSNSNTSVPLPTSEPSQSSPLARPLRQRRATSPLNNTAWNSWIPTVSGVSGLSRVSSLPAADLSTGIRQDSCDPAACPPPPPRSLDQAISSSTDQPQSPTMISNLVRAGQSDQSMPSIRFTPYVDLRSNRESLNFAPIERCLRQKDERIRVGRTNDRDATNPNAPVGFSSKVVSRRHCEFWCENGQWYVKDVKSSSGTFLNHIRLSAPGMESRAYPVNDGDILQLGIDFKGGEEQIFRCVKIRVELNRAWQKALNNFNMSAHRRIRNLAKTGKDPETCSLNSSECAICLLQVAPCQSLFVAPCSHVWHYKCIRPLVEKEYPTFLCPNCRAVADLEREIEEDEFREELWEALSRDAADSTQSPTGAVGAAEATTATATITSGDAMISSPTFISGDQSAIIGSPPAPLAPINVPESTDSPPRQGPATPPLQIAGAWRRRGGDGLDEEGSSDNGSSGGETGHEGPMTPMNDAGPFLLDGGARGVASRRRETLYSPLGPVFPINQV
ncbi:hypothetical protein FN846DRAFT_167222 [Sphaerosporella brunnea]|uniref:RING-type E3 ubiquitin transferase n=1 Tax=Sphaerosporella brunnea TaxID=1250544 RepID=A0A5J5ERN7_9PEZI|nr:hypothetical protein FN846DRAFT_167222 [Sphaerosporella brunnea]